MHKRLLNEATIELVIEPDGPILIKSGREGADPTHPDMEFVRTWHAGGPTVYLPGSSLKGVIRAHCERIVRSLDESQACNPVDSDSACSETRFDNPSKVDGVQAYARSCFICKVFGNTALAGHLRTADAYPVDPEALRTEERDGVAIDRVFGSVAVGPFQYEAVTAGEFRTRIQVHNFTLAQFGLIGLALRDLKLGRIGLGFGKSRGLGRVRATVSNVMIRYPVGTVEADADSVTMLSGERLSDVHELIGVGRFPGVEEGYGYPTGATELVALPDGVAFARGDWQEAVLTASEDQAEDVWRQCMPAWREGVGL